MTQVRRLAVGALSGALLVLAFHPVSRDAMLSVLSPAIPLEDPSLAEIQTPGAIGTAHLAAAWLDEAAKSSLQAKAIQPEVAKAAQEVCELWEKEQPNNLFWPLMSRAFGGKEPTGDWARLAQKTNYDDLQAERWLRWRFALSQRQGATPAWHWAWIYTQRSNAIADLFGQGARASLLSGLTLQDRANLLIAAGRLRDRSKTLKSGWVGANLVEGATYPERLRSQPGNPRALVTARIEFVEDLRGAGQPDLAAQAETVLRNNEGWTALVASADADENARFWCLLSVAVTCLPGGILLASLGGLASLAAAAAVRRVPRVPSAVLPLLVVALAALAGGIGWYLTNLALPAIAASLSTLFLLIAPPRLRTSPPDGLGPLHEVATFLLGMGFLATFGLFLAGLALPSRAILPSLSLPAATYGGSPVFGGLAWLVLCQISLIAGLWSLAQRIHLRKTLVWTLEVFGRSVLYGGLALSAVAGLVGAWADHQAGRTLRMLVENEPANYVYRLR